MFPFNRARHPRRAAVSQAIDRNDPLYENQSDLNKKYGPRVSFYDAPAAPKAPAPRSSSNDDPFYTLTDRGGRPASWF